MNLQLVRHLENVELTDFLKRSLAERVLSVLQQTRLELDENVPKVRLVIFKSAPSQLDYQGKPCTDLDGHVFIFTTDGPKHFMFRFGLLTENIRFLAPGGDA